MSSNNEYATAMIRVIGAASRGGSSRHLGLFCSFDDLVKAFDGDENLVNGVLDNLLQEKLVREVSAKYEELNGHSLGYMAYQLTELGKNRIAGHNSSTMISNVSGSNIALNSPGATQSIHISQLPADIQDKIADFDKAIATKDSEKIKSVFCYIADKAIDVAIGLVTGAIIR